MDRAEYEAQLNHTGELYDVEPPEEEPGRVTDALGEDALQVLLRAAYYSMVTRSLVNHWYPTGLARPRRVA